MTRPTWDETWFAVTHVMAGRALCTRRKVGAVLVKNDKMVEAGYNGTPPGRKECTEGGCPRGQLTHAQVPPDADYNLYPCRAVHAETNCLIRAGEKSIGGTMYTTEKPCPQCQVAIMTAGVDRVVWPDGYWFPEDGYIEEL